MNRDLNESKRSLIESLVSTRQQILKLFRSLTMEMQHQVFLGQWSSADLVAHLIGWDYTNAHAIGEITSGVLPAFYAHHDRDWKTFNSQLIARYKTPDSVSLITSAEESHRNLIATIRALSGEQIESDYGVRVGRYKVTIARLLNAELSDEGEHLEQLKAFQASAKAGHIR